MSFPKRLNEIRTEKKLTREKLGKLIGTSGAIIGMYERGERTPSVEVARRIANTLEVSLDFLVGNTDLRLDTEVLEKIQEIQQLPQDDRSHLFYLVDNVLQNVRTRRAFAK
ncbi:MAG: helix-turn-helix transcriptional regulator [Bacteroidota bacterium]|mgnify:FL=1